MALKTSPNKLIISITACWFLAQMGYYAQYQLLGPLMTHFDLNEVDVTLMMSQEVTIFALTYLLMAGPISRISRTKVALFGAALLIFANVCSGLATNFELLRGMRLLAGVASAMLSACGTASGASSANPQRVFALVWVAWGALSAIQPVWMPYFTVPYGASGGYYAMAAMALLLAPLSIWLAPPSNLEKQNKNSTDLKSLPLILRIAERLGVRGAPHARLALITMLGLFIYEIGQGAIMVFLEQFGLNTGLEEIQIGQVLGAGNLAGLLGGAFAAWLGMRCGYLWPIVVGIIANVVFACLLALADKPISYAASNFLWAVSYNFLVPYMLGVLSELDRHGRWAVAADAAWWFGAAPGAIIGGAAVAYGGYVMLSTVPIGTGLICMIILLSTLKKISQFNTSH